MAVGPPLSRNKLCGQSSGSRQLFARFSAKTVLALEAPEPDPDGTMPLAFQWIFRCAFYIASRGSARPELALRSALFPAWPDWLTD